MELDVQNATVERVAIIVRCLYGGGAERAAGLLSKYLSKKYKVYLFLAETDNIMYEHGGTIVDLGINGDHYLRYYVAAYKRKYRIDCAISFLEEMNFINIQTKGQEKVIISERNAQSRFDPPRSFQDQLIDRLYGHADRIVAVAEGVRYDLIEHFGIGQERIVTIYNFIDKDLIYDRMQRAVSREVLAFADGLKVILNIGRLEKQKNQEKLLIQFSRLLKEEKDVRLLIIGSGRLYGRLCALAHDLEIDPYIKIMDHVADPFPYYQIATIFALTSDWEGLPNVLLEAMTCGVAVVAVDCLSGPRELLKGTADHMDTVDGFEICPNGILVEMADTDGTGETEHFKDAMKLLLRDESTRSILASNGKRYMESYSNEKLLDDWIEVIDRTTRGDNEIPKTSDGPLCARKVIVYGAGLVGRWVMRPYLGQESRYDLLCFAVSDADQNEGSVYGIPVVGIDRLTEHKDDAVVLVGVSDRYRQEVITILEHHGFRNIVFPVYEGPDYLYHTNVRSDPRDELEKWYREKTGQKLDMRCLETYNEKLQWMKLYDRTEKEKRMSDRYLVRDLVREEVGQEYLIPLLGCWERPEDIDLSTLPDRFVLKCTHGPKWSLAIADKSRADIRKIRGLIASWMLLDQTYISGFDMKYKELVPRIMAEEYLYDPDDREMMKFGVFVFGGNAKVVAVDIERNAERKRNFYTRDWELLPYGVGYPIAADVDIRRPECLDRMIRASERLGNGSRHVRVDFYLHKGRSYFSKMVFSHGGGVEEFTSREFALEMGAWIDLQG